MHIDGNDPHQTKLIIHGLIALIGGIANAIRAHEKGWKMFVGNVVVSSFTGFVFGLLAIHFFGEQAYLTTAVAGTGGYLGAEGMNALTKVLVKSLKANITN